MFQKSHSERLKRLARSLDQLAEKDRLREQREEEVMRLRRSASAELHALCLDFVTSVNQIVERVKLDLAPPTWNPESFPRPEPTLFQINVSGRVIQLSFAGTDQLEENVDIRVPYTISGTVRWFNQELVDRDEVRDQHLYFCVGKTEQGWRYVEPGSQRMGVVNQDYLASILEQIVR